MWRVGEENALRTLGASGQGGTVAWHKMGEGWSWTRKQGTEEDHAAAALDGWREIARRLTANRQQFAVTARIETGEAVKRPVYVDRAM